MPLIHFVRLLPRPLMTTGFVVLALSCLAGCSLPRGAALHSELIEGAKNPAADFQVMAVTQASLAQVQAWPVTGGGAPGPWPRGATPGGHGHVPISAGDTLDVVVWDSQQNSLLTSGAAKTVDIKGLKVQPDGSIFVPYLDRVMVAGLSDEAARQLIQDKLAPIVPAAQVQLTVVPGNDNIVDVVDGVTNSGRFPVTDRGMSILSLLAQAGGIKEGLRTPVVRMQRGGKTYAIFAEDIFGDAANNIAVKGGDKVMIAEDKRYFLALGATGREEMAYFPKKDLTALDALSVAGGVNEARADLKSVLVLRQYPAKAVGGGGPQKQQVVFTFDLTSVDGLFAARNFRINPKDVVLATESPVPTANVIFGLLNGFMVTATRAVQTTRL